jgi:hypothetical protein
MKTLHVVERWFGGKTSHEQIHEHNICQESVQEQNKTKYECVMCNILLWIFKISKKLQ